MSGNSIGYVEPLSFSSLTSLQTLDISSNQLIFFPKLPNMTSLKSVDISHNKLQSIEYQAFDDFEKSKVFKTLYVYYRIMFLLFRYEFYDCDIYMKILKCSHFICVWHIYHCLNTEHLQCWCLYPSLLIHFWVHCWCQYSTFLSTMPSLYPLQEAGWELGPGLWLLPVWDSLSGPENHQRRSVWDPCLCPRGPVWIRQQNVTNVLWKPTAHQVLVLWVILLLSIHVNVLHVLYYIYC